MRMVGLGTLLLWTLAAPACSDDIYRWTDETGAVHYSNTPSAADAPTRMRDGGPAAGGAPAPPVDAPGREPAGGAAAAPNELATFSTEASLKRNGLERDLRATTRRLGELDAQLRTLAAARTGRAQGSAATGGVGTAAVDLRSEEEKALGAERQQLAQHATDVRNDAAKLRDEVTARLGATPAWWIDLR